MGDAHMADSNWTIVTPASASAEVKDEVMDQIHEQTKQEQELLVQMSLKGIEQKKQQLNFDALPPDMQFYCDIK